MAVCTGDELEKGASPFLSRTAYLPADPGGPPTPSACPPPPLPALQPHTLTLQAVPFAAALQVPLSQLVSPSGHQRGGYLSPPHVLSTRWSHTAHQHPEPGLMWTHTQAHRGIERHTHVHRHTHTHLCGLRCRPSLPSLSPSLPLLCIHPVIYLSAQY